MALKHLLTPIKLGKVEIRNRIALAPMGVGIYPADETVPDRVLAYVEARSKGGTGMIISQFGRASKYQISPLLGVYDDRFIPGLRRYAQAAHKYGAKVFVQIACLGGRDPGGSGYAPSAIDSPLYFFPPKELTIEQIEEIKEEFIQAARRAQEAGIDGVELHGAHSYLVNQFISPHCNQRTDEYGGSFEGQMKFPTDIVRGIRKLCGEDFPVGFKFSSFEDIPNGIDLVLSRKIAQRMADEGVVYIHAAAGASTIEALSDYPAVPPMYMRRNTLVPLAENMKRHVKNVAIIGTGGIDIPEEADKIIDEGKADMVAIGRGLLADPAWALHAQTGQRIRPCIRCNICHYEAVFMWRDIVCTVNPYLAKEAEEPLQPAKSPKRVMVIGGGPGGIIAAMTASARGHKVALYEKNNALGGMLISGCKPPFKEEISRLLDYLQGEIADTKVEVHLSIEVTPETVKALSPDAVVIAIGGRPIIPNIPGIQKQKVYTSIDAMGSREGIPGKHIVVLGGGDTGCEAALYLAQAGRQVAIVELLDELMAKNEMKNNTMVLEHMVRQAGVQVYTGTKLTGIRQGEVDIVDKSGNTQTLPADAVILAIGIEPNKASVEALEGVCKEVYSVGDCIQPARIFEAIHEGDRIGRLI